MRGCWTCRLRKKKCNQVIPFCGECSRLGLACDGYGNRPSWADGGVQEHEYKKELKKLIRCGHRHRSFSTVSCSSQTSMSVVMDNADEDDLPDSNCNGYMLSRGPLALGTVAFQCADFVYESSSEELSPDTLNHPGFLCGSRSVKSVIPRIFDGDLASDFKVEQPYPGSRSAHSDQRTSRSELLTYYIDHLFWLQFPLCKYSRTNMDRSWLLMYVLESELFREALVRVSKTFKARSECTDWRTAWSTESNWKSMDKLQDHSLATRCGLACQANQLISLHTATAAVTLFHALSVECVDSALAILHIVQENITHLVQLHSGRSGTYQELQKHPHATTLHASAINFSMTYALYVDTFQAATHRSRCILDDTQLWLMNCGVHFDVYGVYGCQLTTMMTIREVIRLDAWKKERSAQGRLSVPELVCRGTELLQRLDNIQTAIHPKSGFGPKFGLDDKLSAESAHIDRTNASMLHGTINQIYVNAARIYIHVIISGANPYLQEIQGFVDHSIDLLEQFNSPDVLACIMWPLMVTMCLAPHEQRGRCGHIMIKGTAQPHLRRMYSLMQDIVQECWRMADNDPFSHWDWTTAIKNIGYAGPGLILPA